MKIKFDWKALAATAALAMASSLAQAGVFIGSYAGNDCAGTYGTPPDCNAPVYDASGNAVIDDATGKQATSPLILKIDFNDDGTVKELTFGNFPSIDGSEFTLDFGGDGNTGTGTWTYNQGDGDPAVTMFTAKGGNGFNLFVNTGGLTDSYFTPETCGPPERTARVNGNTAPPQNCGLSHIGFYDKGDQPDQPVPEPATLALLGLGAAALALFRRRRA